jgi:hypothetical protein
LAAIFLSAGCTTHYTPQDILRGELS